MSNVICHLWKKGGWEGELGRKNLRLWCRSNKDFVSKKGALEQRLLQENCAVKKWPSLSIPTVHIHSLVFPWRPWLWQKAAADSLVVAVGGKILSKGELSGALPRLPQVTICGVWTHFSIYICRETHIGFEWASFPKGRLRRWRVLFTTSYPLAPIFLPNFLHTQLSLLLALVAYFVEWHIFSFWRNEISSYKIPGLASRHVISIQVTVPAEALSRKYKPIPRTGACWFENKIQALLQWKGQSTLTTK